MVYVNLLSKTVPSDLLPVPTLADSGMSNWQEPMSEKCPSQLKIPLTRPSLVR